MSVGEEYQVMKRGKEYKGCGEKYNVEKESNIIFHIILMLLGRISCGEKGKTAEISGKKIKIKKGWEEYKFVGNFTQYTPERHTELEWK